MLLVGADNVDSKQMRQILMSGEGRLGQEPLYAEDHPKVSG